MRAPDGRWVELPMPETANFDASGCRARRSSLWSSRSGDFQPGSVVAFDIAAMLAGQKPAPELVMAPSKSQAIEEVSASDNVLWVKALDDVSGKLFALRRQADGSWVEQGHGAAGQQHHPYRRHRGQAGHRLCHGRGHADADDADVGRCGRARSGTVQALAGPVRRVAIHRRPALRRPRRTARACPISWCARRASPSRPAC